MGRGPRKILWKFGLDLDEGGNPGIVLIQMDSQIWATLTLLFTIATLQNAVLFPLSYRMKV